jgi:hypothetical protein
MPLLVIHLFETVDINEQKRQRTPVANRATEFLGQMVVQSAPVGDPCQRIRRRKSGQAVGLATKGESDRRQHRCR